MKKVIEKIYVKISIEKHEAVFSGISLVDFINCLTSAIYNIMLLKSDYVGEKNYNKFELLEGKENINKFLVGGDYKRGDLCFVDYADTDSINQLNEEQIAELLYLAHMYKPLKCPFFKELQNRFVYLAHDDGYYCKSYFKDLQISNSLILNKIQKNIQKVLHDNSISLSDNLINEIKKLSMNGLIIELVTLSKKEGEVIVRLYEVGEYTNMDALFNTFNSNKFNISFEEQFNS